MKIKSKESILPSEPVSEVVDPSSLSFLLIAEPKWGKTTFFMDNPDALLLGFEDGHKFQKGFKIAIDKWDEKNYPITVKKKLKHMTFMQAIEGLEKSSQFGLVIVDTVDIAVKMCTEHHCKKKGVEHPSDYGAMGKGWDMLVTTPFRQAFMRILKTGRGVAFITHSKVEILKLTSGEKAVKTATLSGGPMKFVHAQADIIMHGELGKRQNGQRLRDRILVTEADVDVLAGNRTRSQLPSRYILDKEHPWKQFCSFFTDPKAIGVAEAYYKKNSK